MNHDVIDRRAQEINSDNTVRQKGTRTRASLISYFDGQDLKGKVHRNASTYAAFISVVTDSGVSGYEKRCHKKKGALKQELGDAFRTAGFVNSEGELSIPGRDSYNEIPTAIGPLMPALLAILEIEHGIDSTEAVRQYEPESLETILPDDEENRRTKINERPEKDWEANIRNAPGFDPDAEAYVYVLRLKRLSDSSTWFYVGKRESGLQGLLGRVRNHAREFSQSRTVTQYGQEILRGKYNFSMKPPGTTHHVVGVDRIVPISSEELASFDNPDAETCYISEIERRTAYEVALDHKTTNVLGGK